jgi:Tfp pilus assembly protein PilF
MAFYLRLQGDVQEATEILNRQVQQKTTAPDIYFLLGELYEKSGRQEAAKKVYQQALTDEGLPKTVRPDFAAKLRALTTTKNQRN